MRKKHLIPVLVLLCISVSWQTFGSERSAVWSRLYRRAETLEDKLTLMQSVSRNPSSDLIPMLVTALDELNAVREQLSSVTEQYVHTELSKIVVRLIGEVGAVEAGQLVFDISKNAEDPYLRGEAIFTLGRLGMTEYADDIAMTLRNLNLNLDTGREDKVAEVLAYASVLALERLKAPVGFAPLFFASIGWYSPASGVRPRAAEVMQNLMEDPTDVLFDIVRLETDVSVKLEGLLAEERSAAPPAGKVRVAIEALRQGLIREPLDVSEATTFSRLRLKAMDLLIAYGADSRESVDYLVEVISGKFDINEQITAIVAIASQRSEYAVEVLVRFLHRQNERQLSGVTPADYRIIRSTIQVLGQMGDERAVEELLAVGISNWPSTIVREANTALEALGY